MPQIAPIVLPNIGTEPVSETYNPTAHAEGKTVFTEVANVALYNLKTIKVTIKPATQANAGHRFESLLVRPVPLSDENGCCSPLDNPPAITVTINSLRAKSASAAQAEEAYDAVVGWVNHADFKAAFLGGSFY